jgi:hypothetical protein
MARGEDVKRRSSTLHFLESTFFCSNRPSSPLLPGAFARHNPVTERPPSIRLLPILSSAMAQSPHLVLLRYAFRKSCKAKRLPTSPVVVSAPTSQEASSSSVLRLRAYWPWRTCQARCASLFSPPASQHQVNSSTCCVSSPQFHLISSLSVAHLSLFFLS